MEETYCFLQFQFILPDDSIHQNRRPGSKVQVLSKDASQRMKGISLEKIIFLTNNHISIYLDL